MANFPPGSRLVVDSSNGISIAGGDGIIRKLGARRMNTALVCGDSITAFGEVSLSVASVTINGDGTATVDKGSASGLGVGQPVRLNTNTVANVAANVIDSVVTEIVSANVFKVQLGGRSHSVTGNSGASMQYPYRRTNRGWLFWAENFLGMSFSTTWCAVAAATADQISALLTVTPMTEAADVGFVCIGMNDIYGLGSSLPVAQAAIKGLIDKVSQRSAMVVILTIPPRNSTDPSWNAGRQAIHTALNRWLHQYGRQIGAVVVNTWRATQNGSTYVNPAAANPDPDPSFVVDNTHPSMRGGIAIGSAVANAIAPFVGVNAYKAAHKSSIGVDAGNLLTGSDFSTGTNGIASNWLISNTTAGMSVTPTLVARTVANDGDACGQNQVVTAAYGTAAGLAKTQFRRTGLAGLLTPGTTVQFKIAFSVSGAVGLQGLGVNIIGTGTGNTPYWYVWGNSNDTNPDTVQGSLSGWLMTPPAVVPSNLTATEVYVELQIDITQTSNLTLTLSQPELIIVS